MQALVQLFLGALVPLSLVIPWLGYWCWRKYQQLKKDHAEQEMEINLLIDKQLQTDQSHREEIEKVKDIFRSNNEALSREHATEKKRADEYFGTIEKILKERDEWRDLYWKQSREHGNAQHALMDERARNFALLRGNHIKPYVNPQIALLVGAFNEQHYEPTKLAAISQKLDIPKSDPVETGTDG
jgi:hypothetical protein